MRTPHTIQAGQIVVFNIKNRDIPIVHRILQVHETDDAEVSILTKGDNNQVNDRGLYSDGQLWLKREDIVGKAVGSLRYIGMVTIWLNDYPSLKYLLVRIYWRRVLRCSKGQAGGRYTGDPIARHALASRPVS
jgi:signal peptidase